MNIDIFEEIKSRINLRTVVTGYGIEINRSGFCLCPFHAEKTPSMKIYDNGFKCYGCGEGGDMFVFVQKLFNLENPSKSKDWNLVIDLLGASPLGAVVKVTVNSVSKRFVVEGGPKEVLEGDVENVKKTTLR